ncbi:MAG TPA: aryl-sulfate sulfotransferase [Candidatus Deferrimicrobiaceae bacterium]|nr:aryl-sulfate sulfotransferase [Candidatus Deferrimicrobiaceae bacterium]
MKHLAPLQPFLLFSMLTLCGFTIACGSASFNDPPGITTSVANTQNPLVAQVNVAAALGGCPGQAMVEFGPNTSYGRNTAWSPILASAQNSAILVAGMRASTTYHMRALVQAQCAGGTNTYTGDDLTFATGALPALPFPTLTVTRPNPSTTSPENPGIELIDVTTAGVPAFFTDRDANPIWYYDVGPTNFPYTFKLLPNGHMILSITTSITAPVVSLLREIDLAGNTIREMPINTLGTKMQAAGYDFVPQSYTHDFVPLANGHLVAIVDFAKNFTDLPGYPGSLAVVGDAIVDLDQNWNPVWAWNSFDHLDVNRHPFGLPDWTHANALVYSPADGNLIFSMRNQSWVLKLDYNNGSGAGDVIWTLGYQGDMALSQAGVPTEDPSVWFSAQHFPSIVSQSGGGETTLAVWDNGDSRVLDTSGDICPSVLLNIPCYSRATIFQIDDSAKVADLTWEHFPGYYGLWGGNINQLGNGNVEFDINAAAPPVALNVASEVQEITQTSTPQIVWKLDISPTADDAYRAYRVPSLYPGVNWSY